MAGLYGFCSLWYVHTSAVLSRRSYFYFVHVSRSNSNVSLFISLSRVYICFLRTNHLAAFIRLSCLSFFSFLPLSRYTPTVTSPHCLSSFPPFLFFFFLFGVRFTLSSSISISPFAVSFNIYPHSFPRRVSLIFFTPTMSFFRRFFIFSLSL